MKAQYFDSIKIQQFVLASDLIRDSLKKIDVWLGKTWPPNQGLQKGRGWQGYSPTNFIAGIYFLGLQLAWIKCGFFYLKVTMFACIAKQEREREGERVR